MMFEQRRNERYEFSGDKVEYTLDPFSQDKIFEAKVFNFSETGLCLLSSNRLAVGQEITIRNFVNLSSRTAVVVWIEKYDDALSPDKSDEVLFKIGLLYA